MVVSKTSQVWMMDATRVGTGEGEDELLDNCSVQGERGTARPEETSLDSLHLPAPAPAPGVTRRWCKAGASSDWSHCCNMEGEGIDMMARETAVEAERGPQRGAVTERRAVSQQLRRMGERESCCSWCGLACACVCMCALPVGGMQGQWGNG